MTRGSGWNEDSQLSSPQQAYYSHRRRSLAVHVPPPGPPPTQPIPSVPPFNSPTNSTPPLEFDMSRSSTIYAQNLNGAGHAHDPYRGPTNSTNLPTVPLHSQSNTPNTYKSSSIQSPSSPSPYNLSDSPPRSQLRPGMDPPHHEIVPDRLRLSPTNERQNSERRPSSRRALTRALELAREAVRLDSTNDDPYAAVVAYGKSVALLSEVMERVMRGEDSTESNKRKSGRRRSVVAQEEEVKRLRSIHDTYAERMNILSLIYSIPVDSHLTASTNHTSTSVRPSSPETSASEISDYTSQPTSSTEDLRGDSDYPTRQYATMNGSREIEDGVEAIGTAMFGVDYGFTSRHSPQPSVTSTISSASTLVAAVGHPYSTTQPGDFGEANGTFVGNRARTSTLPSVRTSSYSSTIPHRARASSTLPPAAPPPTNSPPPAPAPEPQSTIQTIPELPEPPSRQSITLGHRRTGSGTKLGTLREEVERRDESVREGLGSGQEPPLRRPRSKSVLSAQRQYNDSQPLPPLPGPENQSPATPRFSRQSEYQPGPSSPDSSNFITPRARGDSTVSARSDSSSVGSLAATLINNSPVMGTISQRRSKTSAPPSMTGSPTEAQMSASIPNMNRLNSSGVPNSAMQMLNMGRNRATSQPGRRPATSSGVTTQGQTVNGLGMRKISIPSKLGPNAQVNISINTVLGSPYTVTTAAILVPPPPIHPENLPSTPASPLPPSPPTEHLRQPYHMMNLIRQTMTSKTGGYVTRRLHVPYEVWSQGGAKLSNIPEKVRVVEVLLSALEEIQNCSAEIFGAGNVSSGMVLGIGSIGKKEGELWASKLEEFSGVCDGVVSNFGKKLAVGEGFVTKKSGGINSWGGKLTRRFDKLTAGKNLDSPATYVQMLSRLFLQTQLLDEHTKAISSMPVAPAYAAFPIELRIALEAKLRHASEFFARVVLTFVVRDLSMLLDKYLKKCEKWLAE